MESVRRARFKSEASGVDSLLKALPAIRARVTSIGKSRRSWDRISRMPAHLGVGQRGPDFRVIGGPPLDHLRSADQVNAHPDRHAALRGSSYSITWSAGLPRSDGGMVSPSVLAVFRLNRQLELCGPLDGKSAGLAP